MTLVELAMQGAIIWLWAFIPYWIVVSIFLRNYCHQRLRKFIWAVAFSGTGYFVAATVIVSGLSSTPAIDLSEETGWVIFSIAVLMVYISMIISLSVFWKKK